MRCVGGESFDRGDRLACGGGRGSHTGPGGLAVEVNRARAAERLTTAELRAGEPEYVANDPEHGHVGLDIDAARVAVNAEFHFHFAFRLSCGACGART